MDTTDHNPHPDTEPVDDQLKSAALGDDPAPSRPPTVLLGLAFLLFLAFIGSLVLLGLSARCNLGSSCSTEDFSHDRYTFETLPFPVPFQYLFGALSAGLLAAVAVALYAADVVRREQGSVEMREIAAAIADGSAAFLRTEYIALLPLVIVLGVLLGFAQNWPTAGCYFIGAALSGLTGYIGMSMATRGNVRTTAAAATGLAPALNVAFRAGAVMGLSVVAVGLVGLASCYLIFRDVRALAGFAAGASTVALFARVGGGIYTKAADVGADLVGKVEANIPEDDPRNPATIADNVGDNVGDVAGMGADLFESYVGSVAAAAILASTMPYFHGDPNALCVYNHLRIENDLLDDGCAGAARFAARVCRDNEAIRNSYPALGRWEGNAVFVAIPFLLALSGVLVSVLCTVYVRVAPSAASLTDRSRIMASLLCSLRVNIFSAGFLVLACAAGICFGLLSGDSDFANAGLGDVLIAKPFIQGSEVCPVLEANELSFNVTDAAYEPLDSLLVEYPAPSGAAWRLFLCIAIGLVLGNLIGGLTEYFTAGAFSPTQGIAAAGTFGAGAVVIQGLGVGLLSTGPPLVLVAAAIVGSFQLFGAYGVALAAVGMLSTLGVTMATDAYGPVADNAGGIAEMAGLPAQVRDTTDALDALGNTTAATGKGFSTGSAVLTAYALLTALVQDSGLAASAADLVDASNAESGPSLRDYDEVSLVDPFVVCAVLVGVCLPFVFGAMTMLAVSRAAQAMIVEVRRQFREIVGLREGAPGVKAEHVRCIDISTRSSIAEMVLPGALAIMAPLIVGFGFGQKALVGLLLAAIVSGYMMGVLMSNAGGAWDNSKKLVESGFFGKGNGKGSEWHKATVAGDTVGDPFKDTSGPSMNILIKMMTTFGLVTVSLMKPERERGWIGGVLLAVTFVGMVAYAFLLAAWNKKTSTEASKVTPEDAAEVGDGEDAERVELVQ